MSLSPREIDALVHEKVFGFMRAPRAGGCGLMFHGGPEFYHMAPRYSLLIEEAWKVVEEVGEIQLTTYPLRKIVRVVVFTRSAMFEASEATAPMAICLASLRAKGVEV